LDYTLGENGHQIEDIYNFPSTKFGWVEKSSEYDISSNFEWLQLDAKGVNGGF
jgi:hypothetical protein